MNTKRAPKVRFKGFTDAWELRKLGEVGSVSMCRRIFKDQTSESGDIPFYKIGTFGGEPDAFISIELFEEYKVKYPYPKKGDILISASGSIGRIVEFMGKNEYFQDSNIVWLNHDERLDNTFLKCFYSVVKWAGIEGSTIKRLYNDNILNTVINLPTIEEQQKIGAHFEQLDRLITLHQRKLDKMKELKKAFLDLVFSQKLRFRGFDQSWRKLKIEDCFSERVERSEKGELISVTVNFGIVKAHSLDRKDNSSENKSNYKIVRKDDIAYNSMRMWQGASGISLYEGILSPAYTVIVPKQGVSSLFFSYEFKLKKMLQTFQVNSQGLTSDTWNLKFPLLRNIVVEAPEYEEQEKVGIFFKKLDNLITLRQEKINQLTKLKTTFLKNMFI